MQVSAVDFISSPALYLDRVRDSVVTIMQDGNPIAVLVRPQSTPITDSLLGLFRDLDIDDKDDIKAMRTGV